MRKFLRFMHDTEADKLVAKQLGVAIVGGYLFATFVGTPLVATIAVIVAAEAVFDVVAVIATL